jgi:hypothetical protein
VGTVRADGVGGAANGNGGFAGDGTAIATWVEVGLLFPLRRAQLGCATNYCAGYTEPESGSRMVDAENIGCV